jgi:hypothetical protein
MIHVSNALPRFFFSKHAGTIGHMIMSALHVEAQPTTKKKKKKSAFYKRTGPNVRCSGRSGVQLYLIHTTQQLTKRGFFLVVGRISPRPSVISLKRKRKKKRKEKEKKKKKRGSEKYYYSQLYIRAW